MSSLSESFSLIYAVCIVIVKYHENREKTLGSGALFSKCRKYRYALWRIWSEEEPHAMFIGLNPSTADELQDDPTVRRCISYARSWGYGGLWMANLFALRSTDPKKLSEADDPVGTENDKWILKLSKSAAVVVAAWGNYGGYLGRSRDIVKLIRSLCYLKLNKTGEPAHPLYLKGTLRPVRIRD